MQHPFHQSQRYCLPQTWYCLLLLKQWPTELDLAFPSWPTNLHAIITLLTSSTTGPYLSLMKPLAKTYNIANFSAIQHIKRSGVLHTLTNVFASVKVLVPTPPTQDKVLKAPTTSRSSATRTFLKNAVRRPPIPKWFALSYPKNMIRNAPVLPLEATTFATQGMWAPKLLH